MTTRDGQQKTILERIDGLIGGKISRAELARNAGLNSNTVGSWWSSSRAGRISVDDAVAIAKALGTTAEYLVTGKNPEPPKPKDETVEQTQLVDWIRSLSKEQVQRAWTMIALNVQILGLPAMVPLSRESAEPGQRQAQQGTE